MQRNKIAAGLLGFLIAGFSLLASAPLQAQELECEPRSTRILVGTKESELLLCEAGKLVARFPVHLGRGGTGKKRQGDNKVPLGTYTLGMPRKSKTFWMFIPVGYPTAEQKKQGLTGSDVGVHGPHRSLRWLGSLNNTFASTAGCIGLAKNAEIESVAAWVKKKKVRTIEIR